MARTHKHRQSHRSTSRAASSIHTYTQTIEKNGEITEGHGCVWREGGREVNREKEGISCVVWGLYVKNAWEKSGFQQRLFRRCSAIAVVAPASRAHFICFTCAFAQAVAPVVALETCHAPGLAEKKHLTSFVNVRYTTREKKTEEVAIVYLPPEYMRGEEKRLPPARSGPYSWFGL